MSDNKEMIIELKKINELLEKIDWKLWTLHEKVFSGTEPTANGTKETVSKDVEPVVPTAKYPTIETWE
jgi:hypothetical protein